MLKVDGVVSGYGDALVLHGISAHIKAKEITGFIGPNGSGKSTLLKTIIGLLKPKEGKVFFKDEEITGLRPDIILKKGIALVPQGRSVFPYMTVLENLEMGGYTLKDPSVVKDRLEEVFNEFPVLKQKRNQIAYTLSGGEQTMLCFGRALMLRPELILLDEPSIGLAPKSMEAVFQKIKEMNEVGRTLAVVEQNVKKVLSIADYVYVLAMGRNRYEGSGQVLLQDPELARIYLGK